MNTNQWFKLAILAFAGIILSSLSLSIITPAQQSPQNPAVHTQGTPGQHGGSPAVNGAGGAPGYSQMDQSRQLMEMQQRLWELQNRLNMGGSMPYGSGMPYGNTYGPMPMNPNPMPGMPGVMPYGYGYPGGMYGPNPNIYPGNMSPNMNNQGSTNMPSGNNSNSNSSSGGGMSGGMSMM